MADEKSREVVDDIQDAYESGKVINTELKRSVIDTGEENGWKTNKIGDILTYKIDVDVSDTLTGLKAVQREAKKAVQSLREVEAERKPVSLTQYSTMELAMEIERREGEGGIVARRIGDDYFSVEVTSEHKDGGQSGETINGAGQARVLIVLERRKPDGERLIE